MGQEREKFAQRFDTMQKEILALTEGGISASRIGKEKLWTASVTILAFLDVATGELTEDKCYLEWQLTDEENQSSRKIFHLKGESIYRLKVQESFPFTNQDTGKEIKKTFWVKEVLERDCHEERLNVILEKFRKPVIIQPDGCEELVLDKSLGMFSGEGTWNGKHCLIHLDVDEDGAETANESLDTLKKLMSYCREWDQKARKYAAAELVECANDWAEEEEKEITEDEFAKRLSISEVCASIDGDFEIFYDDDDMFYGHVVIVSGNIETGIDDADMAG